MMGCNSQGYLRRYTNTSLRAATLFAIVAAGTVLTACGGKEVEEQETEARPVRAITLEKTGAGQQVVLSGRIAAQDEVAVAFRIGGRMIERPVNVGDRVRAGQVIARLEPMNERNQRLTAQAALNAALADQERARDERIRQESLIDEGFTTRARLDQAVAAARAADALVASSRAQLQIANDLVSFTELKADTAGYVTARGAEPGEVVQAGQMIVRIAREGGTDAVFEVPPQVLRARSSGQPIEVALTDDPKIRTTGQVREVSPQADPVTGTFTVRVGLELPPTDMRLGSVVSGTLTLAGDQLIVIPSAALTNSSGEPAVWVVNRADSTVALRQVRVLRHEADSLVIGDGLAPGDTVVTAGVQALRPGQKVRLLDQTS
jgi:RND family efflux transporter MFP subunit